MHRMHADSSRTKVLTDAIPNTLYNPPSGQSQRHQTGPISIETAKANSATTMKVGWKNPSRILMSATHIYGNSRNQSASCTETMVSQPKKSSASRYLNPIAVLSSHRGGRKLPLPIIFRPRAAANSHTVPTGQTHPQNPRLKRSERAIAARMITRPAGRSVSHPPPFSHAMKLVK